MPFFTVTRCCLGQAEVLSGVALAKEMRRRIRDSTLLLSRPPCLVVVLVGLRQDSRRYVEHKKRAAKECGIEVRVVELPETVRQRELHRTLAAVNGDVSVDGVILQLPLPPHLRARHALFHIHPGKDVDGLHPLNAGNLFLRDQSPLMATRKHAPATSAPRDERSASERFAQGLTDEVLLLATSSGGYNALQRRSHESKFFVPCTALAIRSILFSCLSRMEGFSHLLSSVHSSDITKPDHPVGGDALDAEGIQGDASPTTEGGAAPRDLHAVIVNKSMVVGVPTAALLQGAGGFVVTSCSRSNSLDTVRALTRQADVLITAYGVAKVFDSSCIKKGAIVIDAAVNELPLDAVPEGASRLCGDIDMKSVMEVAAAVTKTPGGVGPLTVSHLMLNVLKAYRLRHTNHLYYNNIYTEFLRMYGTYDKVRDYAPSVTPPRRSSTATSTTASTAAAAAGVGAAVAEEVKTLSETDTAPNTWDKEGIDEEDDVDDGADADNESYEV